MNFQGKAVLVYLEEDNIARAYFRVQPLMTQDGPLGPVTAEYPDNGFLRIVPDKNEQHTFKDRMRTLSGLCLVDLRFFPSDANKIRTNKNYSPSRGETNQFIVYSDAVRALPDDLLYQVVAENALTNAITPFVYIRNGANIQGPFRRDNGQPQGEISPLPPDSTEIHSVTVNGQDLLFYWPKAAISALPEKQETIEKPAESAPAPAPSPAPKAEAAAADGAQNAQQNAYEKIQNLNQTLSESANRLHNTYSAPSMEFLQEQAARQLTGTKLYQAPQRQTNPRRAHNSLMEAVENQRYASRYDTSRYEAPGATLPQNTEFREVANPADALKRALLGMSHSCEDQRQAADVILAQSGMRVMLSKALARETNDLTLAAMHTQLQELEAERLMTLMQLDDAKKNLAEAHEQALGKLNMAEQKKLDQLHIAQQNAQNALDELNKAIAPLERQRADAAQYIDAVRGYNDGGKRVICPAVGREASKAELIERVEASMKAAGFQMEEGDALMMLAAFALSNKNKLWQIRAETLADGFTALDAFAAALGTTAERTGLNDDFVVVPGGTSPVFISACHRAVFHPLVFTACLEKLGKPEGETVCRQAPHCDVPVYPDPAVLPCALPHYAPASLSSVISAVIDETPLSDETKAVLSAIRKTAAEAGASLPLETVDMMAHFIATTQNDLKGGVAEAIDRACCLYLAAHILACGLDVEAFKPHLAAMPRTLKALKA
ncbi:MAG: hypothetical protein IKQ41_02970 [Clostridia bacterium]|nr:hypothetical protein [Clostridia bacterium]